MGTRNIFFRPQHEIIEEVLREFVPDKFLLREEEIREAVIDLFTQALEPLDMAQWRQYVESVLAGTRISHVQINRLCDKLGMANNDSRRTLLLLEEELSWEIDPYLKALKLLTWVHKNWNVLPSSFRKVHSLEFEDVIETISSMVEREAFSGKPVAH